jgi:alpha-glucosidase
MTARDESRSPWWRHAVIYQIYVRSFADANGDGVGDLAGIRQRLPAVAELGVDAVWITPFYPSPQADGGYDVADYRDVDPLFGTLADFDALLDEAHDRQLRVIVDLVPNHTSHLHPWFQAACAAPPGSPPRDRYLFRDGRGSDGHEPPNDWLSVFGGRAWSRITEADGTPGQWYLHLFTPEQPDLNWLNDEVRAEFDSILRFWLDRGVDGFRIDVAHGLAKDPDMPDLAGRYDTSGPVEAGHPHWDQDEVHDVYRSWRRLVDEYDGERMFVAEAWVHTPERLARYVRPDELHTAFNFNFLLSPWDAHALRTTIEQSVTSLASVGAPPTWVLSNHDVVRHVTRYGGGELGGRRARAALLLMLALPGGAYLYQGEELGLPEVVDLPDAALQDPTFFRTKGVERGRDGCRVPLPWWGDRPSYGFGPTERSWLPQPPTWAALARDRQQTDHNSMLGLYRQALRLRRQLDALRDRELQWIAPGHDADRLLAFHRGPHFVCAVNTGDEPVMPPTDLLGLRPVLTSRPLDVHGALPGASAAWFGAER